MTKLTTQVVTWGDLTEDERLGQPNNGVGRKDAEYLRILHNGRLVATYSTAMEPEDVTFNRDLAWITKELQYAYLRGFHDAEEEEAP